MVPDGVEIERVEADDLPAGWDGADARIARQLGDRWLEEGRSGVLLVPSVVARAEQNVLVNPAHLDAARLVVSEPRPVVWDRRLFSHGK
jgi:RES domain-containing protein